MGQPGKRARGAQQQAELLLRVWSRMSAAGQQTRPTMRISAGCGAAATAARLRERQRSARGRHARQRAAQHHRAELQPAGELASSPAQQPARQPASSWLTAHGSGMAEPARRWRAVMRSMSAAAGQLPKHLPSTVVTRAACGSRNAALGLTTALDSRHETARRIASASPADGSPAPLSAAAIQPKKRSLCISSRKRSVHQSQQQPASRGEGSGPQPPHSATVTHSPQLFQRVEPSAGVRHGFDTGWRGARGGRSRSSARQWRSAQRLHFQLRS
jgi:hypothetical protein